MPWPTRSIVLPVALLVGSLPGIVAGSADPAMPSPDNPQPRYPSDAQAKKVEGNVTFVADVDERGRVTEVRILSVPGENLGFEEAVREVVMQWAFRPARRDGRPIPSQYESRIEFYLTLEYERARMYGISAETAWQQLLAVLSELGLKPKWNRIDEDAGLVVTGWRSFRSKRNDRPPKPDLDSGYEAQEFSLNILVPKRSRPARVYVDSRVRVWVANPSDLDPRFRGTRTTTTVYSHGAAERWLFERLEDRVGVSGEPIPQDFARRRALAVELLGSDDDRCLARLDSHAYDADGDDIEPPVELWASTREELPYPAPWAVAGLSGKLSMVARISPDGVIDNLQVIDSTYGLPRRIAEFTVAPVAQWRFRPAELDGCPVPVLYPIVTEFNLHPIGVPGPSGEVRTHP